MDPQQNQNPIIPATMPTLEPVIVPPPAQPLPVVPQAPLAPEAQVVPPGQPIVTPRPMAQPVQPKSTPPYTAPQSSKKGIVIGAVVLVTLLIAGGGAYALLGKKNQTTASNGGSSPSSTHAFGSASSKSTLATTSKSACDLYPQSDAQAIMGTISVAPISNPVKTVNNVNTSICVYSSNTDSATIIVASAANSSGNAVVNTEWSKIASAGLKSVSGVGDKAYYNPTTKALAVLRGNTFVVISENKGNQTQIAKTVISNF